MNFNKHSNIGGRSFFLLQILYIDVSWEFVVTKSFQEIILQFCANFLDVSFWDHKKTCSNSRLGKRIYCTFFCFENGTENETKQTMFSFFYWSNSLVGFHSVRKTMTKAKQLVVKFLNCSTVKNFSSIFNVFIEFNLAMNRQREKC